MSTIRQIIDYAKRKFPNSETDANCIIELNDIQDEIYIDLEQQSNSYTTVDIVSVASQEDYILPTSCKIENIIKLTVLDITQNPFSYAGLNDNTSSGYYYKRSTDSSKITLLVNGSAIAVSDYNITISYYPRPTAFTAVTETPSLDAEYHKLFKYALVQVLASQGDNPDTDIADHYQAEYDAFVRKAKLSIASKQYDAPEQLNQAKEGW